MNEQELKDQLRTKMEEIDKLLGDEVPKIVSVTYLDDHKDVIATGLVAGTLEEYKSMALAVVQTIGNVLNRRTANKGFVRSVPKNLNIN